MVLGNVPGGDHVDHLFFLDQRQDTLCRVLVEQVEGGLIVRVVALQVQEMGKPA